MQYTTRAHNVLYCESIQINYERIKISAFTYNAIPKWKKISNFQYVTRMCVVLTNLNVFSLWNRRNGSAEVFLEVETFL